METLNRLRERTQHLPAPPLEYGGILVVQGPEGPDPPVGTLRIFRCSCFPYPPPPREHNPFVLHMGTCIVSVSLLLCCCPGTPASRRGESPPPPPAFGVLVKME